MSTSFKGTLGLRLWWVSEFQTFGDWLRSHIAKPVMLESGNPSLNLRQMPSDVFSADSNLTADGPAPEKQRTECCHLCEAFVFVVPLCKAENPLQTGAVAAALSADACRTAACALPLALAADVADVAAVALAAVAAYSLAALRRGFGCFDIRRTAESDMVRAGGGRGSMFLENDEGLCVGMCVLRL
mmetsp:Transcript_89584/g.196307  ORF Transcript_89584/g.196307 Transcript_89584/m.196307 type:complete len:186 (-) Transcript_89584:2-559(-)